MKSIHLAAGLAVVVATFASGPDAVASGQITVSGRSCGLEVSETAAGVYAGHVFGGPILASTPRGPASGIYLLCTVQLNDPAHSGPDTSVTTSWGAGTTSVAPTPVRFRAAPTDVIALCTEIWVDTGDGHVTVAANEEGHVFIDFDDSQPRCPEQINIALPGGSGNPSGSSRSLAPVTVSDRIDLG